MGAKSLGELVVVVVVVKGGWGLGVGERPVEMVVHSLPPLPIFVGLPHLVVITISSIFGFAPCGAERPTAPARGGVSASRKGVDLAALAWESF